LATDALRVQHVAAFGISYPYGHRFFSLASLSADGAYNAYEQHGMFAVRHFHPPHGLYYLRVARMFSHNLFSPS